MNEPEANPNMENKCPQCGAPLPTGGLAGLCPACLLKQAATETSTQPEAAAFIPPTVEELAKLFPQLEIISLIGKGGMGAVYQARQPILDRIVALKILPSQAASGRDFAERFNREARALARLNHPNIVTVHEFGQVAGMPFFLMEYVDGMNLRQLEQAGKLSPREALQIVPQICEALQFAHDAGIVHRDIKPDNILIDKKGRVKIADFGIAKIIGTAADSSVPETQGAIGTPHYMAPEQVEKPQTVDHRADIFSLGVVFYEMLTGELPLGKFAPPSSGPRGMRVDVRLDEVVLRALEKEPDRRYQHVSQVKSAVETIASTSASGSQPHPNPGPTAEALLRGDYSLDIGNCASRGWALVKAHFWPLVGMHALILLIISIAESAFVQIGIFGGHGSNGTVSDSTSLLGLILAGPLWAGLMLYFLKIIRGETPTVETAFSGFSKRFLHLFLVNLVAGFLTFLGFICFILPGIYLLVSWCFALVLVMDKGLEFWPAMELSRKMVHKHWWKVFGFGLVLAGIWLLGLFGCCIGVLISAPVAMAVFLYGYEVIFGGNTLPASGQPFAPPPIAGAAPQKPAGPANPASPENPAKPGHTPDPIQPVAAAAGVAGSPGASGPKGPYGTVVLPAAPGTPPPTKKGGGAFKYLLLAVVGLICLLIIVGLAAFLLVRHTAVPSPWRVSHRTAQVYQPVIPAMPQPVIPPTPVSPVLSTPSADGAYYAFVEHVRQELAKNSARFEKLYLSSTGDNQVQVTFSGLEQHAAGTGEWSSLEGTLTGLHSKGARTKWDFRGQGDLAAVQFAMTRFDLKKTLAGAGNLGNLASAPVATAAFGPVRECLLQTRAAHSNEFLNLDTGRLLTPPEEISDALAANQPNQSTDRFWEAMDIPADSRRFSYITWLRENGVDLLNAGQGKVIGFDGTFAIAHGNTSTNWDSWDNLTPAQAANEINLVTWSRQVAEASMHGQPIPAGPANGGMAHPAAQIVSLYPDGPLVNLLTRDQSVTWYFKTRSGTLGVLQILEVANDPSAIKIRYKLADKSPASPVEPAEPVPATERDFSHESFGERLEAAQTISNFETKDQSLATLSLEAANAGDVEIVKSALEQMSQWERRDSATREAVLVLAKNGHRKQAIEMAESISNFETRDKVLAELAQ